MTHEEYKEKFRLWEKCDSISERNKITETVLPAAIDLLQSLDALYEKYGKCFNDVYHRHQNDEKTAASLNMSNENCCLIHFEYQMANFFYVYSEDISIDMQYLDEHNISRLEKTLKEHRKDELAWNIKHLEKDLNEKKAELEKMKAEANELNRR